MEEKIKKWFEAGLGDIGFHPLHVDLSPTKTNLYTVEVKGSFLPFAPWFNSAFLLKLSNRLDAMVEMNGTEELDVDGILESPELFWIVPDIADSRCFRMMFKVKYVPKNNQTIPVDVAHRTGYQGVEVPNDRSKIYVCKECGTELRHATTKEGKHVLVCKNCDPSGAVALVS